MSLQSAASSILQRAVELDSNKRYTESLICYQEGLQVLVDVLKGESGDKRTYLRNKVEEYMNRAEQIKNLIEKLKNDGSYHEQIEIENDSTGHSYQSVFGRFLDDDVEEVKIEDPYVRTHHQCQNLVRLCELLVLKCKRLKVLDLLTIQHSSDQKQWLEDIKHSLTKYNVMFKVTYSNTLHDRQISLSTGWIIKIGRGLDYFKATNSKFSIGTYEMDLRTCHETTVDIFHQNNLRKLQH